MLWNFFVKISRHGTQRRASRNASEPKLGKSQKLANASPAFDEWLQAYRMRLEEVCQRADSGPVSPARANG
jgi:hypothetical protein